MTRVFLACNQRAGLHHPLYQRCTLLLAEYDRNDQMGLPDAPKRHRVPRQFANHGESDPDQKGKSNV